MRSLSPVRYTLLALALVSAGYGQCGDGEVELWEACYDIENTTQINLEDSGLWGPIPDEIGQLVNLEYLNLSDNQIDYIPASIGNLVNLMSLSLDSNELTVLPPEIGDLVNLFYLDLDANSINSLPPEIGSLTALEDLDLFGNWLTELPPEIGDLSSLTDLELSANDLTDLPPEFGNLSNLRTLNIRQNPLLTDFPLAVCDLENLTFLEISIGNLGAIPPEIGSLTSLIELNLGNNELTEIPSEIGNLTNLVSLDLDSNSLNSIPASVSNLSSLINLDLGSNELTEIPPEIGEFASLTTLTLRYNNLLTLPSTIGDITSLTHLDLQNNDISNIPDEIGNLADLVHMDLTSNDLTEIRPIIGGLINLRELYLDANRISSIAPEIGNLSSLEELLLSGNLITELPPEIGDLENLSHLGLGDNSLHWIPEEIGQLSSLEILGLNENLFTEVPSTISSLGNLTSLQMDHNFIESISPELLTMSGLRYLYLNQNNITGQVPPEIGNMTDLHLLYLNGNSFSGQLPDEICNLDDMDFSSYNFNLSDNMLCPPYPSCIEDIGYQDTLNCYDCPSGEVGLWGECYDIQTTTSIDLSQSNLTGQIPPHIGNLTNLEDLKLTSNHLIGQIPPEIGQLASLITLDLGSNDLTGSIPVEIGNLTNLTYLDFDDNQLTGLIPSDIGSLTSLETLNFGHNQLQGLIPSEIGSLAGLESLDLAGNQLTGPIPGSIGDLESLLYLRLYSNQITGGIPPEIGSLTSLQLLMMNTNELTGTIPPEIGNLTNLVTLRFENNQLAGVLPPEIGSLINLEKLWIYDNQLFGEIPEEIGNLTNLESLRFENNQLTGQIPEEICNQGDSTPSLDNNYLCPPYPGCLSEEDIGYQITSYCTEACQDGEVGLWGVCYDIATTTSIVRSYNGIVGTIPSEVGDLINLTTLKLNDNDLAGAIPPEIWNLTNLEVLSLGDNNLTGEIPSEIGNLTSLESINLGGNQLTGPIPAEMGSLTNLTQLYLLSNQLTGPIPSEIGNLINLNFFLIQDNMLSGIVPESLCNLDMFEWPEVNDVIFNLSDNMLCPPFPGCISSSSIGSQEPVNCDYLPVYYSTDQDIESFSFSIDSGQIVDAFGGAAGEYGFQIDFNSDGAIFAWQDPDDDPIPPGEGILVYIAVDANGLSCIDSFATVPPDFSTPIPSINCMSLCFNDDFDTCGVCGGDGSSCIGCPDPIACNYMDGCDQDAAEGEPGYCIDSGQCEYPETNYDCDGNCDESVAVELWGQYCFNIETTYELHYDNFQELQGLPDLGFPQEIGGLINLRSIDFRSMDLAGEIPSEIGNLTYLEKLLLADNSLTLIPETIAGLVNLERLDVSDNQLTSIPDELYSIITLNHLILNDNFIDSPISDWAGVPLMIGNLTNLHTLRLQNNELHQYFPDEIVNLTNLQLLSLENNQLYGTLPEEIGTLADLSYLSIEHNQLWGEIPESICDLDISPTLEWDTIVGNNMFCPPYPECIFGNIEQDTSQCPDCFGVPGGSAEVDECGECGGPGLNEYGCCGDELTDCFGACGGSAMIDACGICDGDGSSCAERTIDITYSSGYPIAGIEFEVDSGTISDVYGGVAESFYINISSDSSHVIIWSPAGNTIEPGDGLFIQVDVSGSLNPCLSNLTVYNQYYYQDQYTIITEELDITELSCTGFSICGNQSIDCHGTCGGSEEIDECGICGGEGIVSDGWCGYEGGYSGNYEFPLCIADCDGIYDLFGVDNSDDLQFCSWFDLFFDSEMGCVADCSEDILTEFDQSIECECVLDSGVFLWDECYPIAQTTEINLPNSGIDGPIPNDILDLVNLTSIDLSHNQISGYIPDGIDALSNLIRLDLKYNNLEGGIPYEIGGLANLEALELRGNNLDGEIQPQIQHLSELKNLSLGGNSLTGQIPSWVGELDSLEHLNLYTNQLSGQIPAEIFTLENLGTLFLGSNNLTGTVSGDIMNLSNLYVFKVEDNSLSGSFPETVCSLDLNFDSAGNFDISGNRFCPTYPECIESYVGDQDTSGCTCIEGEVDLWGECYPVETTHFINLNDTGLSGAIPYSIGDLVNLQTLELSNNDLSGLIPSTIGSLVNLQTLDLGNNQLTGNIPGELDSLGLLEALDLSGNNLSGIIPAGIWEYDLFNLYLNDNQLSGEIPQEIGNLDSLFVLNLSNNQLTGEIPSEIGSLIELSELRLHSNQLSGQIPEEICDLSGNIDFENDFSISSNMLCPPYPLCLVGTDGYEGFWNYVGEQDTSLCCEGEFDQCGVCEGDNSSCGCTDQDACNYSESAVEDDGSCTYPEPNMDCSGTCLLDTDCAGVCGGAASYDECGICSGDGTLCYIGETPNTIWLSGSGTEWSVGYYIEEDFAGFQFTVIGSYVVENSTSGGTSEENGFLISSSNNLSSGTILGFSLVGATIPAGTDTLLYFETYEEPTGLEDLVFAGPDALSLDITYAGIETDCDDFDADGVCDFEDECVGEYDGCGECGGPGLNEYGCCGDELADCFGTCGGNAVLDECGECDGDGIGDGFCDCDGNVLDCLGECGGSAVLDECEICNGDGLSCIVGDEPNTIWLEGTGLEWNIMYNSDNTISAMVMTVSDATDLTITGGIAIDQGMNVVITPELSILGVSISPSTHVPAGAGVLLSITTTNSPTGIEDIIISGNDGQNLNISYDGLIDTACAADLDEDDICDEDDPCIGAFDECGQCNGDNYAESCIGTDGCSLMDCAGACDGESLLDGCGTCDGPGPSTWYQDMDEDGLGDPDSTTLACEQPDGYAGNQDDIDDSCGCPENTAELCYDCLGECNGTAAIDECGVCDGPGQLTWYLDQDTDGLGDPAIYINDCSQPDGYVSDSSDLDDSCTSNEHDCLGVCDGSALYDECDVCDGPGMYTWYLDSDIDGLGDPDELVLACDQPDSYVSDSSDLDDSCTSNEHDCYGTCDGIAYRNDCDICVGGETGTSETVIYSNSSSSLAYENGLGSFEGTGIYGFAVEQGQDCSGECGGSAALDSCGACVGGLTGHSEGESLDQCGDCFGQNDCLPKLVSYSVSESLVDVHRTDIDLSFSTPITFESFNPVLISSSVYSGMGTAFDFDIEISGDSMGVVIEPDTTPFASDDRLTVTLRADDIVSLDGVRFDANQDNLINDEGLTLDLSFDISLLGDFDLDSDIDVHDIDSFVSGWRNQDTNMELGPFSGTVPNLIPSFDQSFGIYDMMGMVSMWNWYHADKDTVMVARISETGPVPDFDIADNTLSMTLPEGISVSSLRLALSLSDMGTSFTISTDLSESFDFVIDPQVDIYGTYEITAGRVSLDPTISSLKIGRLSSGSYEDQTINLGYELIGPSGEVYSSGEQEITFIPVPDTFGIYSVYPNPFNPRASVIFGLSSHAHVDVSVLDLRGRVVDTIFSGERQGGYHLEVWDASRFPSGMYIVRVSLPSGQSAVQKVMLIK